MTELDLGPTGIRVSINVAKRREALNLTYAALEKRLISCGHRIPALGLRRIEARARRVDVDDLLALAFALECTPLFLLSPATPNEPVTAIKEGELTWEEIRTWIQGRVKLTPTDLGLFWEREAIEAAGNFDAAEKTLTAIDDGKRSASSKPIYEKRRDEALERKTLSEERMAHYYDDFYGEPFPWANQNE